MARTSSKLSYKPFPRSPESALWHRKVSLRLQASYTGFAIHWKFHGLVPTGGITTWLRICSFTVLSWNMLVRKDSSSLILDDRPQAAGRTGSNSSGGLNQFHSTGITGYGKAMIFLS